MSLSHSLVVAVNSSLSGQCGWALPIVRPPGERAWLVSGASGAITAYRSYADEELSQLSSEGAVTPIDPPRRLPANVRRPAVLFARSDFLSLVSFRRDPRWVEAKEGVYALVGEREELDRVAEGWAETILRRVSGETERLIRNQGEDDSWGGPLGNVKLVKRIATGGLCARAYDLEGALLTLDGRADALPRLYRFEVAKAFPELRWDAYLERVGLLLDALRMSASRLREPSKPLDAGGRAGPVPAARGLWARTYRLGLASVASGLALWLVYSERDLARKVEASARAADLARVEASRSGEDRREVAVRLGETTAALRSVSSRMNAVSTQTSALGERTDELGKRVDAFLAVHRRDAQGSSPERGAPLLAERRIYTGGRSVPLSRAIPDQPEDVRRSVLRGALPALYAVLPSATRGGGGLIDPVSRIVDGPRPEFRWGAIEDEPDVVRLVLVVVRASDPSRPIARRDLAPGATHARVSESLDDASGIPLGWELVRVRRDGSPDPSPARALFAVLPRAARERIAALSAAGRPSLELAVLYARAGRYALAGEQIRRLRALQADPEVEDVLVRLAASLKGAGERP